MPETGNEIDTALKELSARYKDATDRARELTDAWVRYLVAINGGAIGITFGLASAYSNSPVSPSVFGWPVGAFTAGLICAGVAVLREQDRQDQRANKASNHMSRLASGKMTLDQARVEWNELFKNQGEPPWPWPHIRKWRWAAKWRWVWRFVNSAWTPPRNAAFASFVAFLVGIVFSLLALSR